MRVLLITIFLAPIAGYAAYQSGAESVTPFLISMALVSAFGQFLLERRERGS